ncbi:hypothetical protein [Ancylobacter sp.]|uniref:hypothetical protein n=1 Tax=Ancylobacter sp. TaxID=1872567 RepID=UPI003D096494
MKRSRIIAAAALAATLTLPAVAQAQSSPPSGFPWLRNYASQPRATNQAALNGDAAIRWQETINAYSRGR